MHFASVQTASASLPHRPLTSMVGKCVRSSASDCTIAGVSIVALMETSAKALSVWTNGAEQPQQQRIERRLRSVLIAVSSCRIPPCGKCLCERPQWSVGNCDSQTAQGLAVPRCGEVTPVSALRLDAPSGCGEWTIEAGGASRVSIMSIRPALVQETPGRKFRIVPAGGPCLKQTTFERRGERILSIA